MILALCLWPGAAPRQLPVGLVEGRRDLVQLHDALLRVLPELGDPVSPAGRERLGLIDERRRPRHRRVDPTDRPPRGVKRRGHRGAPPAPRQAPRR
jgi:hypothetical protein